MLWVGVVEPFFEIKLGNILTLCGVALAYASYIRDQRKQARERLDAREKLLVDQTKMHTENASKLSVLLNFQEAQIALNRIRDKEVTELEKQTIKLTEIAIGFNRRLEMLERRRNPGGSEED